MIASCKLCSNSEVLRCSIIMLQYILKEMLESSKEPRSNMQQDLGMCSLNIQSSRINNVTQVSLIRSYFSVLFIIAPRFQDSFKRPAYLQLMTAQGVTSQGISEWDTSRIHTFFKTPCALVWKENGSQTSPSWLPGV